MSINDLDKIQKPHWFTKLDLFSKRPHFYIHDSLFFQTKFGAFFSIIVSLLILTAGVYFGREIWLKDNPTVNTKFEVTPEPGELVLDKDKWDCFFGLQFNNTLFIDESFYTIKGRLFTYTNDNGLSDSEFNIEPCTENSLSETNKEIFSSYSHDNAYCISWNNTQTLSLQKMWGQEGFSYIDISIWPCINSTENNNSCATPEELNNKLSIGVFDLYTIYYFVDSTNYHEPYTKTVKNSFFAVSYKTFIHSILWIYHSEIKSDIGFLLTQEVKSEAFFIDSLQLNYYSEPETDSRYVRFQFQVTNYKQVYQRSYIKLQTFCAQLGGLINFFIICGTIICFSMNEFMYRNYLVNYFYDIDYEGYDKKEKGKKQNTNWFRSYSSNKLAINKISNSKLSKLDNINHSNVIQNQSHSLSNCKSSKNFESCISDNDHSRNSIRNSSNNQILSNNTSKNNKIIHNNFININNNGKNNINKISHPKEIKKDLVINNDNKNSLVVPIKSDIGYLSNHKNNFNKNQEILSISEKSKDTDNLNNQEIQRLNKQAFLENEAILFPKIIEKPVNRGKFFFSFSEKLCFFCRRNHKNMFFDKTYQNLKHSLSIENILNLNQTIHKMRYFLLTDYENKLFDSIGNPITSFGEIHKNAEPTNIGKNTNTASSNFKRTNSFMKMNDFIRKKNSEFYSNKNFGYQGNNGDLADKEGFHIEEITKSNNKNTLYELIMAYNSRP